MGRGFRIVEGLRWVVFPQDRPRTPQLPRRRAAGDPKRSNPTPPCRRGAQNGRFWRPRTAKCAQNDRFLMILDRFWGQFSTFCEVTSHEQLDSQREWPNLCVCWHARYFRGFVDFAKKRTIDNLLFLLARLSLSSCALVKAHKAGSEPEKKAENRRRTPSPTIWGR